MTHRTSSPVDVLRAPLHAITGLGRPLDLRLASNRAAVVGTFVAGSIALALFWSGSIETAIFRAGSVAAGTFLAWALARELDPDHPGAATLAMMLAGVLGFFSPPAALMVGVLLLAARINSGTVGSDLRPTDMLVLIAAAGYAGTEPVGWPVVGLLVFAVMRQRMPTGRLVAAIMSAAAVVSAALTVNSISPGSPGPAIWVLIGSLALVGWYRIRRVQVDSVADSGRPISSNGVALARLTTLTALASSVLLAPEGGLMAMGPAVAAFAAVAVWPRRTPKPAVTVAEPEPVTDGPIPAIV